MIYRTQIIASVLYDEYIPSEVELFHYSTKPPVKDNLLEMVQMKFKRAKVNDITIATQIIFEGDLL